MLQTTAEQFDCQLSPLGEQISGDDTTGLARVQECGNLDSECRPAITRVRALPLRYEALIRRDNCALWAETVLCSHDEAGKGEDNGLYRR